MHNHWISMIAAALQTLLSSTAFSLCTLAAFGGLFYRKVKHPLLFPLLFGAGYGLLAILQQQILGGIDLSAMFVIHTVAAFLLVTARSWDHLFSLLLAELFAGSLILSVQTAVFALARGGERGFWAVTLLYVLIYGISVGFVYFLQWLVRSDDREPLGKLQMLLLTGVTCAAVLVNSRNYGSTYIPDVAPEAALPSVLLLMAASALLLLSVKHQQARHFQELSELSERYLTMQAKHFEQTREADTEMRMLRHDMKNHITVLSGLYEQGKTEELGSYLRELGGAFAEIQGADGIGNEIADAVIAEKRSLAGNAGTVLVTEGSLQGLAVNAMTLCTILSGLLDNAIEAAQQTEGDRTVTLTAKRSGSFCYIRICNPTAVYVETASELPTSKPDSTHHGLGLKSVRKAVGKCGGTLELGCKPQGNAYVFTAEVLLPAESLSTDASHEE